LLLSIRVSRQRIATNTLIGSASKNRPVSSNNAGPSSGADEPADSLSVAMRSHANFAENVPFALIFAGLAELNGADRRVLNYALLALLVSKVAHVEAGMLARPDGAAVGRLVGHLGTQVTLVGLAGWAAWLARGYWGF
ncbi:MAG: hypothetical protein LQ340_005970, partial [Diploschistes diacapsis]